MKEEGDIVRDLGAEHYRHGTTRGAVRPATSGALWSSGDLGRRSFFLSLEDDLVRIFAGDCEEHPDLTGMEDGQAIENKMVSRRGRAEENQ